MKKLQQNLFYYYTGKKDSEETSRQVENNTTKSLINVLENCGREARGEFISRLVPKLGKIKQIIKFALQKSTIGDNLIRKAKKIYVLVIYSKGPRSKETKNKPKLKESSIPDAWIYNDNFVILIEINVMSHISLPLKSQIKIPHWN